MIIISKNRVLMKLNKKYLTLRDISFHYINGFGFVLREASYFAITATTQHRLPYNKCNLLFISVFFSLIPGIVFEL